MWSSLCSAAFIESQIGTIGGMPMRGRVLFDTIFMTLVAATALFVPAGEWHWAPGWLLVAAMAVFGLSLALGTVDGEPIQVRAEWLLQRRVRLGDRLMLIATMAGALAWFALMAIDATAWSVDAFALWVQAAGLVLLVSGGALWMAVIRDCHRRYAPGPQVQRLYRGLGLSGPRARIRHPLPTGALLMLTGIPLMLGSPLGLAIGSVLIGGVALWLYAEEKRLINEAQDYAMYLAQVKWRVLPGIW